MGRSVWILLIALGCSAGEIESRDESLPEASRDAARRMTDGGRPSDCGDGIVDAIELCDDGNRVAGDGCDAGCEIEIGFECAGSPSVCALTMPCTDCHASALCDEESEFECVCPPGYSGDGHDCIDIDECAVDNGGCSENALCENAGIPGAPPRCLCPSGYTIDGSNCVDVDECAGGSSICGPNAACQNSVGGYECACLAGYALEDGGCVDVDCLGVVCDEPPEFTCAITELAYPLVANSQMRQKRIVYRD